MALYGDENDCASYPGKAGGTCARGQRKGTACFQARHGPVSGCARQRRDEAGLKTRGTKMDGFVPKLLVFLL